MRTPRITPRTGDSRNPASVPRATLFGRAMPGGTGSDSICQDGLYEYLRAVHVRLYSSKKYRPLFVNETGCITKGLRAMGG